MKPRFFLLKNEIFLVRCAKILYQEYALLAQNTVNKKGRHKPSGLQQVEACWLQQFSVI
jgi:hypothetical protein